MGVVSFCEDDVASASPFKVDTLSGVLSLFCGDIVAAAGQLFLGGNGRLSSSFRHCNIC